MSENTPRRPTDEQQATYLEAWRVYLEESGQQDFAGAFRSQGRYRSIQENFIAACFLMDTLIDLGAPDEYRESVVSAFGKQSVGSKSVWALIDSTITKCEIEIAQNRANTPGTQVVPEATPTLQAWWEAAKISRDDLGVHPHILLTVGLDGVRTYHALDTDGNAVLRDARQFLRHNYYAEVVFGIDMTAAPDQDIEFADFMFVIWYVGGQFYTGIVNYQCTGATPPEGETEPVFRPIRWDNVYWNRYLREMVIPKLEQAIEMAATPIGEA